MRPTLERLRASPEVVHNLFTRSSPAGNRARRRSRQPLAAMRLETEAEVIRAGDLEVRPADHLALARGRVMALSVREQALLEALACRQGRIVARGELYATVWGAPLRDQDRSVDVYVHKLRSKLALAIPERSFIHTHFGFGYRFEPEDSHPFHKGAHKQEQDGLR
jgi:DNA-binding response OmpR family regulator